MTVNAAHIIEKFRTLFWVSSDTVNHQLEAEAKTTTRNKGKLIYTYITGRKNPHRRMHLVSFPKTQNEKTSVRFAVKLNGQISDIRIIGKKNTSIGHPGPVENTGTYITGIRNQRRPTLGIHPYPGTNDEESTHYGQTIYIQRKRTGPRVRKRTKDSATTQTRV